jgi:tetratricopeptide (TPR) repeat protein/DNA-binding transcriptional ArsR family regulator
MIGDIAIYDPRRLSEPDFLAGFVARLDIYEFLIRQFQSLDEYDVATHRLIVGQRGMGKTTLLRRIAIGIEADAALRERFAALTFREEQYDIRSLAQLWRNCSEALAEWLEACGRKGEAEEIDRRLARERLSDPDAAWELFAAHCAEVKRRPVLFLDNINLILGPLPEAEGWKLRGILQARGGPVVIGASAAFLEQSVNPKAPFYEFFQVHTLEPLSVAETRTCLTRIAEGRREAGKRVLATLASSPERVPVLHTLTGGNPRTIVFIYRLLESERDGGAQRDLETLLDDVTGLYKARVEELPEQARAVFDAVALAWDPAPTALLVETTMLEPTTLSPQLNRLVDRGYVERTERADGKSGWQVAERFFNIWYLMRHGNRRVRQRLRWLTTFLTSFYSRDELTRMGRDLAARGVASPDEARYLIAVSESIEDPSLKHALTRRASMSLLTLERAEIEKVVSIDELDADARALDATAKAVRAARPWPAAEAGEFLKALRRSGRVQSEQQEIVDRLPAMPQSELNDLLKALHDEAEVRWKIDLPPEVAAAVERAIDEGALRDPWDIADAEAAANMAENSTIGDRILLWAVLHSGDSALIARHDAALAAACQSCGAPRSALAAFRIGALLNSDLNRPQEAEAAYREATRIDPAFAWPWHNLGNLLQDRLARYDEAEAAYREAIRVDPASSMPWNGLGNLLQTHLARYDEAEAAYREAIRIDPVSSVPWNGLGSLLADRLTRYDEAEAAYRTAIRIDPANVNPWNNLGDLLSNHLGRYDEAEAAYREAIRIDPDFVRPWNGLGNLLADHLTRYDEAEAAYREAIRIDPAFAYPWNGLGNLLASRLARYDEAEAAYRETIRIDPAFAVPWYNLGALLQTRLARYDEAEAAYREAIRIDPAFAAPWYDLGTLLQTRLARYDEAEAAYREAIRIDPAFAWPWNNLGNLLQDRLARYDEAEAAYREAIRIDLSGGGSWISVGNLLADHRGDPAQARAAYREAEQKGQAAMAQANLLWLELAEGRGDAARELRARFVAAAPGQPPFAPEGLLLIDSGLALIAGNVDEALHRLADALRSDGGVPPEFFDDLLRLLRLFAKHGTGVRLLAWLDETGLGETIAPVRAAFDAYLHDERKLLNVNPETRGAARRIYRWLTSNRRERDGPLWPGPGTSELDRETKPRKQRGRKRG